MEDRPQVAKVEDLAKVYHEVAERAARILSDFAKKGPQSAALSDELGIAKAYMDALRPHARRSDGASHACDQHVARLRAAVAVELDEDVRPEA